MITKDLMDKYDIKNAWRSSQKDASMNVGFKSANLCELVNGNWLAIIDDEVIEVNTRATAMKLIRKEGYWTRVSKVRSI